MDICKAIMFLYGYPHGLFDLGFLCVRESDIYPSLSLKTFRPKPIVFNKIFTREIFVNLGALPVFAPTIFARFGDPSSKVAVRGT